MQQKRHPRNIYCKIQGKFSKPGPHKAPEKRSVPCGMHVNCAALLVHPPPSPKYKVEGLRRCLAKNTRQPGGRFNFVFGGLGADAVVPSFICPSVHPSVRLLVRSSVSPSASRKKNRRAGASGGARPAPRLRQYLMAAPPLLVPTLSFTSTFSPTIKSRSYYKKEFGVTPLKKRSARGRVRGGVSCA